LRTLAQPPDIPTPPGPCHRCLYICSLQDKIPFHQGLWADFYMGLYNDVAEDMMWVDVTLEPENEISMT